jgi:hypothetical protein
MVLARSRALAEYTLYLLFLRKISFEAAENQAYNMILSIPRFSTTVLIFLKALVGNKPIIESYRKHIKAKNMF